jgi:integrase
VAHLEDLWIAPDGRKRPRHGKGRRYRVRWVDPSGAERSKSFPDGRRGQADNLRKAIEADIMRDEYHDPRAGKITLHDFSAGTWLPAQTFSASTREITERRLRLHLWPVLGDVPLSRLTPSRVQAWVRGLDCSPTYARALLSLLSSILNAAVDDRLIPRNPCKAGSVRAPKPEDRKIIPWGTERISAIRAALPKRFAAMADCGSGLGMRQGEVLALAAEDVDWLRRVIHVRRQVKIVNGKLCFGLPKGGKGREVPLPDAVGLRLSTHIADFPPVQVTLPWDRPGAMSVTAELLFATDDHRAINRHTWNNAWRAALRAAGVPAGHDSATGFHQLRHHFASSLLAGGVDIRALAEYLGHHSAAFTLSTYTHLMPSAHDRMRTAIDAALSADGPGTAQEAENA